MEKREKVFWLEKLRRNFVKEKWTCRRISFVGILIATSVTLVIFFTKIIPIASLPSFKLTAGGLPIKITGYIFGPMIGLITGVIADLITFLFLPTYYHIFYTIAFAFAGIIPGIIGYFMNQRWKDRKVVEKSYNDKLNWINYISTIIIITIIISIFFVLIIIQGDDFFAKQEIVKNKWFFLFAALIGLISMLIGLLFFNFFLSPKLLNSMIPIIAFSAILDITNTALTALGDIAILQGGDYSKFLTFALAHMLLAPMKSWFNLFIILTAYKIISPLIYSKADNGWSHKVSAFNFKKPKQKNKD